MKKTYLLGLALACCGGSVLIGSPTSSYAQTAAAKSDLAAVSLPQGALRYPAKDVPKEVSDALQAMMDAGGSLVKRGKTEVLGWAGAGYKKSQVPTYKSKVATALKAAGWEYEEGDKIEGAEGATVVSAIKTLPTRKALIGFWLPTDEGLLLAWTEMLPAVSSPAANQADSAAQNLPPKAPTKTEASAVGVKTFEIDDATYVVNVMKGEKAKIPTFPALAAKRGYVRGYVKDSIGKPLANARLGVRSSAVGGAETSAQGKTDEKGYYEIKVPFGVAGFYNAGYAVDYGDGFAPLGLYPADGQLDDFATPQGYVKNWVLLPYGIADRAGLQTDAKYSNNYFGGQVVISFQGPDSPYGESSSFPEGATLELTLTPREPLIDGSQGPTFVLHKTVREGAEKRFYINNIPLSRYRISGRALQDGRTLYPLLFQETGPYRFKGFGLAPGDIKDSNELMLRPYDGRAEGVTASHGHWAPVEIDLKH